MRLHNSALSLYNSGNFQTAGQLFHKLTEQKPEDKLYKLYEDRCQKMAKNPPPHWDGITDMRSK